MARSPKYTKDNSVWNDIKRRLRTQKSGNAKVGFLGDKYGAENNYVTVAYVARANNEGWGNPHRPFFYNAMDEVKRSKDYKKTAAYLTAKQAEGEMTKQQVVEALGNYAKILVEETIYKWDEGGLAGGSSSYSHDLGSGDFKQPLIDTSLMVNSVKVKYDKKRGL